MPERTVEKLTAEVDVDAAKAIAELEAFKAAVKDASNVKGKATIETDFDRDSIQKSLYGINKNIANFGKEAKGAIPAVDGLKVSTKDLAKQLGLLKVSVGGIKLGAIALVVSPAVNAINALAGATVALTGALAPVTGLVATIPQGLAAMGQGGLVAVAGLGGLKKALDEVEKAKTLEEQQEALNSLTPALREMVDLVRGPLKSAWTDIQQASQEALLPGLKEGIEAAMPLLDGLRPILASTGNAIGGFATAMGQLLGSAGFGEKFATIADSNVRILDSLGESVVSLTSGLQDLMIAAAPMTEALGRGIASAAEAFRGWAEEGNTTGRLQTFFEETLRVASQLKTIFGELGGALGDIGSAAAPLGRDILDAFQRMSEAAHDWTSEAQNAAGMTDWFNSLKEPLRELAGLVGDVVRTFIEMQDNGTFTNIIQNVRDLIPTFQAVFEAAGKVLDLLSELATVWTPLAAAATVVGEFASALSGLLDMAPALKGLIATFVLLKTTVTAINFVNLIGGLAGLARGAAAAKAGTLGLTGAQAALQPRLSASAGAMGILKSSAGGAALAVTGLITAYQMYNSVMSEAKAAGESVTNGLRDQMMNVDAAEISMADLNNITATYGREIEGLRDKLAGSQNPFDHEARAGWRAQIESSEQLRGEWMALIPAAEQLAAATGMATQAALSFVISQWQAGASASSLKSNLLALAPAYTAATEAALANQSAALEASRSMKDAAIAADRDAADAARDLVRIQQEGIQETRALANAQEAAAEAAINLAESYALAAEHLEDLRFAQRSAVLSEARAINRLEDAYDNLAKLQKKVGKATKQVTQVTDDFTGKIYEVTRLTGEAADAAQNQIDYEKALRDALLDIAEAQLGVEMAKDRTNDATKELSEAERNGIMQSDLVVAAQKRLRDANYAVRDAIKAQQDAAKQYALAVENAEQRVRDTTQRSKDAWSAYYRHFQTTVLKAAREYANALAAQLMLSIALAQIESDRVKNFLLYGPNGQPGKNGVLMPTSATGGTVFKDQVGLVGERGPELFIPSTTGTVVPAHNTDAILRSLDGGGSKDGLSAGQIESIVSSVMAKSQKPAIQQVFNEKVDPLQMGNELSWRLR